MCGQQQILPVGQTGSRVTEEDLVARLQGMAVSGRKLVALAGPPAAGKSTVADRLAESLNQRTPGIAAVVPMDGYHFDDVILADRGLRKRKGAPETFDVGGLHQMLARLRYNHEEEIAVPLFDRELEISRAGARVISSSARLLLVEGNYLLLNEAPWSSLHALFDLSVMLDTPEDLVEKRLRERWNGLKGDRLADKLFGNDLPNAKLVREKSVPAALLLRTG